MCNLICKILQNKSFDWTISVIIFHKIKIFLYRSIILLFFLNLTLLSFSQNEKKMLWFVKFLIFSTKDER